MTAEEAKKLWVDAHEKNERADLRGADLHGANLRGADLRGADLRGADMHGADLRGADLRGADMHGANLYGADLRGADLHGTNLRGVNLRWADLRGADMTKRYIKIGPIGSRNDETVYNVSDDVLQCGCFVGTLDEFSKKSNSTHGESRHGKEYKIMVEFLLSMRDIEVAANEEMEEVTE